MLPEISKLLQLLVKVLKVKSSSFDPTIKNNTSIIIKTISKKIRCFLVACCYGRKYSVPGSIIYNYSSIAPKNISLFSVQILETLIFTLIFIYMIKKTIKNKFNNKELGIFIILCGTSKFLLDFLRMKTTSNIFSTNQLLSLVFIFIGIFIFIKYLKEEND